MKKQLDCLIVGLNIILLSLLISTSLSSFADSRGLKIVADPAIDFAPEISTYRALIIGNNDYQDPERLWQPLKRAVSDARAVEGLLVAKYGFTDVLRIENASRRELLHGLRDFGKRINPGDSVLVYYAGHGFLDQSTQKGYWVPVDAEGTDHASFVRNSTIRDEISDISRKAKHTLLISDSCFSGTLLKSGNRGIKIENKAPDYLASVNNKKSVQIITAGGMEYVDDDYRSSGHSPFTYFLKSELENNPHPVLTASELSQRVKLAVSNNVEQEPQIGVLEGAGDELGEFLFIKVDLHVSGIDEDKIKVDVNVSTDDSKKGVDVKAKVKATTGGESKKKPVLLPVQSF